MSLTVALFKLIIFWTHVTTPLGDDAGCGCNIYDDPKDGLPICRCNRGTCFCFYGLEPCTCKGDNCACAQKLCYCQSKEPGVSTKCCCEEGKCKCGCPQHQKRIEVHDYRWVPGNSSDQIHLYDGKVQIGTYRYDEESYFPYNTESETWGFACLIPKNCPNPPSLPKSNHVSK